MPTFNEAGAISGLMTAIAEELRALSVPFELIVVDDDSPDLTWQIAEQVRVQQGEIRVLRRRADHGLTASLREGIDASRFDVVVWLDCDFSHPPERIPQMLYMLGQGFDVVVNSRYTVGGGEDRVGKGGPLQLALSRVLNWTIRFMLQPSFSDYTSGFVAVRRPVLEALPLRGDYGEYFLDFVFRALKQGFRVCEVPFVAPPRRAGESKTGQNLLDYTRRGSKYLLAVARVRAELAAQRLLGAGGRRP
jgi:dolichol-phosphate mannosyltransferase